MTRTAVYCRISDDRSGEEAGVRRQEADCRELAGRRGWEVGEVFVDNDTSAYSGRRRPAYGRMLEAIKAGDVDAVVVWHLDRLHRRPIELEQFFEVCDVAGLTLFGTCFGEYDLATHDGRLMARILGAVARKESDDKSRRTKRKHAELAQAGAPVGSGRPFGYDEDRRALNRDEAELVRDASRRVLRGESLRSICVEWNAAAVRTTKGNRWNQSGLRRMLSSARIAGLRSHGPDGPTVTAQWPAIVDEETHRRLRTILADPDRRVNWGFGPRKYLLTGLLFCELCGTRLIARAHEDRKRCYVCASGPGVNGCGKLRVVAAPLEELVADRIFAALDSPAMASSLHRTRAEDDDQALLEAVAGYEAELEQLARDHYADHRISRGEFFAARQAVEHRLEAARRRLVRQTRRSAAEGLVGQGASLSERWGAMSLHQKRGVVEAVIERIDVGPARRGINRFDPERVPYEAMRWRV